MVIRRIRRRIVHFALLQLSSAYRGYMLHNSWLSTRFSPKTEDKYNQNTSIFEIPLRSKLKKKTFHHKNNEHSTFLLWSLIFNWKFYEALAAFWNGLLPNTAQGAIINAAELASYYQVKQGDNVVARERGIHHMMHKSLGTSWVGSNCSNSIDYVPGQVKNDR